MGEIVHIFWILLQVSIGYNLILPFFLLIFWLCTGKTVSKKKNRIVPELDFAIIVTAYQHTETLAAVVESIAQVQYRNYHIYVVADNCFDSVLAFDVEKLTVLKPEAILGSNTQSHLYALERFIRQHDCITIIDSDNIVHPEYLSKLNTFFQEGYQAVQGFRAAKNLNTTISCLDAARDIYYHFYDGKVLFEIGSSATLSGSGMAFSSVLYANFLKTVKVHGAGFDKVLQAWLVMKDVKIAFDEKAIVYDEKTSKTDQLVQQRSRWINSWFKYVGLGFKILAKGIRNVSKHQVLFGIILLRPPLFIFLALSTISLVINLFRGEYLYVTFWAIGLSVFVMTFYISLVINKADKRIFSSLKNIPKFVYYQFVSLIYAKRANQISVSTKHERADSSMEV